MTKEVDLSFDWLADAPLTADQRYVWTMLREELSATREKYRELTEKIQQIESQYADHEPTMLTRPEFNREVARMLAFDERYGGISSVLYFDIDDIEAASEKMEKSAINSAIRQISDKLIRNVRTSDIVGRLAPDEFGVLLVRCDNPLAWVKAESVAGHLQVVLDNAKIPAKINFGAYTFRGDKDLAIGLKEAAKSMTSVGR